MDRPHAGGTVVAQSTGIHGLGGHEYTLKPMAMPVADALLAQTSSSSAQSSKAIQKRIGKWNRQGGYSLAGSLTESEIALGLTRTTLA